MLVEAAMLLILVLIYNIIWARVSTVHLVLVTLGGRPLDHWPLLRVVNRWLLPFVILVMSCHEGRGASCAGSGGGGDGRRRH